MLLQKRCKSNIISSISNFSVRISESFQRQGHHSDFRARHRTCRDCPDHTPAHTAEVPVSLDDSLEKRHLSRQKIQAGDNTVYAHPGQHYPPTGTVRKILVHHQEVVAEIEVQLAGRVVGQSPSPDMIDPGRRHRPYLPAGKLSPPAQVYLLHVREKRLIQQAQNTRHGVSYCPMSSSTFERIRPRQ